MPDRFGRTIEDVIPLTYDCYGQVVDPISLNSFQQLDETAEEGNKAEEVMSREDLTVADWRSKHAKQIKAQTIVAEAQHEPTYVDVDTGDNVVHALSRLNPSNDILLNLECFNTKDVSLNLHNRGGNYILLSLEYFIQRGVDLNLHNREGNHPLKSFICDRHWLESETEATMSEYLNAILWKDLKKRIRNNVNVNMKDREGATALHSAAIRGRPNFVRSLIEAGANVNARSGMVTDL